jgi:hypothetical protein
MIQWIKESVGDYNLSIPCLIGEARGESRNFPPGLTPRDFGLKFDGGMNLARVEISADVPQVIQAKVIDACRTLARITNPIFNREHVHLGGNYARAFQICANQRDILRDTVIKLGFRENANSPFVDYQSDDTDEIFYEGMFNVVCIHEAYDYIG